MKPPGSGHDSGVNPAFRVANPPARPLLLYDGDCKFCRLWIHRWQLVTGDFLDYLPFQDPRGAARFPEIPGEQFAAAVQFILPDGSVYSAAEAVCRSLACNPEEQWLLELYQHSPVFVRISETAYGFVARHRRFFSALTRLLWGGNVEPPGQNLVRWVFLRGLGIIYLLTFLSLWMQVSDLIGSRGRSPAAVNMAVARQHFTALNIGWDRYHLKPTLCWLDDSDRFLKLQCAAGTLLAGLLVVGIAPAPCLFLLWAIYLSLATVGSALPEWQWGRLLLETGFLAIFFAPLQLLPRRPADEAPPSRIVLWLLRWLLFRLLLESAWASRIAGPNPNWLTGLELLVLFLIFLPRQPRQCLAFGLIALQLVFLCCGVHVLFHLLILVLCLTLFDDAAMQSRWPYKWRQDFRHPPGRRRWSLAVTLPLVALVICAGYAHVFEWLGVHMPGPEPVVAVYKWLQPLLTFNRYGPLP